MKVKECGSKVQNGTLEAFPCTAAGVHTLVYGGPHVLAFNVIPLLALELSHELSHPYPFASMTLLYSMSHKGILFV